MAATSFGLFACLATLDVVHHVARPPGPDEKVTATATYVAAGGPAANAAVTFAALGGRAVLATVLGSGAVADLVRADLQCYGVEVLDLAPPGTALTPPVSAITVTAGTGERSVVGSDARGAPDVEPSADLLACVSPADVVLLDGHHPRLAVGIARAAHDAGVPVVVDLGRWKPVFDDLAPLTTHAVCSAGVRPPGATSAVDTAAHLRRRGVPAVVATAGAGPVRVWSAMPDGEPASGVDLADTALLVEVPTVPAVDTLGAGDAFHGAYAFAVAQGAGAAEAARLGVEVAAERVQHAGPRAWLSALRR
ncbi:PfkB family carbohydrate kinase [Miniimonas arenae]|uniref:PfkB family carbohydrate kinase n=1 Tax=Miniimonas arenae TaxID=676201 RepID=UPI0028ABC5FF|nr:PfkB family carbohydrate kinase [Miniimonas arenae]